MKTRLKIGNSVKISHGSMKEMMMCIDHRLKLPQSQTTVINTDTFYRILENDDIRSTEDSSLRITENG